MSGPATTAVVVGSGPNGLAAALVLARAGLSVTVVEAGDTPGGGVRSSDLLGAGLIHDHCSAVHPLAQVSPLLRDPAIGPGLADHGLRFATAPVDMVHVLSPSTATTLHTSAAQTGAGLPGHDGRTWQASFAPLASRADAVADELLGPLVHLPRHPLLLAAFGAGAALPASWSWRRWRSPDARALFAGIAAHAFTPLHHPASAAAGTLLTVAGHRHGWPVAVGGSRRIADTLIHSLRQAGGTVTTGTRVTDLSQLGDADIVLLDTSVEAAAGILGDRIPGRVARAWSRFTRGPAVAKIDVVLDGDVPWTSTDARRAGTVHLGGTAEEIAVAERDCWEGRLPDRPFTLVAQQYLADPSRSRTVGGRRLNPLWAYSHVPAGWDGTAQETFDLVAAQIERVAPGFRDAVVDWAATPPSAVEAHNANNVGGDISGGANHLRQLVARPRFSPDPYFTGVPGVYLCSSSTAPGGGVHFMCGVRAAERALTAL
ncbi:phytoene desaturase family protein [Corynebacterium kalidii]|uniref:NAD(P)/FAD-dependent oxidoreductase n=1 Tax=Corynebacterium kalidii TaxID=2931982 RepID=A0A9X1WH47_9CORY|nr:NAD(P)/FAD-dependent oxidoreductase [Corynebacterium kalidii]MCJ7858068.1 NAD(P)/FAD-dependent oxidoreductase [Corynebacterium kalidii]